MEFEISPIQAQLQKHNKTHVNYGKYKRSGPNITNSTKRKTTKRKKQIKLNFKKFKISSGTLYLYFTNFIEYHKILFDVLANYLTCSNGGFKP